MKILITGASGQIGSELVQRLLNEYPNAQIETPSMEEFNVIDIYNNIANYFHEQQFDNVYHLAGILSAKGEEDQKHTWSVNVEGLFNILDASLFHGVKKVFWPSSIAAYSFSTMYGVTKMTGEYLCGYYRKKGLDVRSLRFPGIISYKTKCGGGTTDWAVEMFTESPYACFLKEDTLQPFLYMPDALDAIVTLMSAPSEALTQTSYDVVSCSFTPGKLFKAISEHREGKILYEPDFRQSIADSWPQTIDDFEFRHDTGWAPQYDFKAIVADMIKHTS